MCCVSTRSLAGIHIGAASCDCLILVHQYTCADKADSNGGRFQRARLLYVYEAFWRLNRTGVIARPAAAYLLCHSAEGVLWCASMHCKVSLCVFG